MIEVGVRELRRGLSAVLRRVASGERVRVTSRGRPVAEIVPVESHSPDRRLQNLVAGGQLTLPVAALPTEAPPLERSEVAASDLVIAERDNDR